MKLYKKNDKYSIIICINNYMETKINLRTHQSNAIHAIYKSFDNYNKCLVKMFNSELPKIVMLIYHLYLHNKYVTYMSLLFPIYDHYKPQ